MARRSPAYPITAEWRANVRKRLRELEMTERQLADRVRCAQSTISEALSAAAVQSSLVPDIHRVLGWPAPDAPGAPIAAGEYSEIMAAWPTLPDVLKQSLLDQIRGYKKRTDRDN